MSQDPLAVALVAPEYPGCGKSFGVGRYIANLAQGLEAVGCRVKVVAATPEGCYRLGTGALPEPVGIGPGLAALRPLVLAPWITGELDGFHPDVVEFSNWAGLGARVRGPWLSVVRLSTPISLIRSNDSWRRLTRPIHQAWERRTVLGCDLLIADSAAMADCARRLYGRMSDLILPHHWPGVATSIEPSSRNAQEVLFVGRLEHRKGIDTLIAAWRLVRLRRPQARLHLVGLDRGGFAASCIAGMGGEGIEVHGWLDDPALATLRRTCTIAVVPSRFESFGLVVQEAWGAGLAVVASSCAALAEVVDGAGILVRPGSVRDLAGALVRLIGDPDLTASLAQQGRERLDRCYRSELAIRRTITAYRDGLARLRRREGHRS